MGRLQRVGDLIAVSTRLAGGSSEARPLFAADSNGCDGVRGPWRAVFSHIPAKG